MQTVLKCLIRMLTALYESLWGGTASAEAREYVEDTIVENALAAEAPSDLDNDIKRMMAGESRGLSGLPGADENVRLLSNEKLLAAKAYVIAYVDDNGSLDFLINAIHASPADLSGIRLMTESALEELDCLLYQGRISGGSDEKVL